MLNITSKTTKKITEASYLCMGNSFRYRAIVRIAYKKYEKMKYSLYKEEIFDDIKKINVIEEKSMSQLNKINCSELDEVINELRINKRAAYQELLIDEYLNLIKKY